MGELLAPRDPIVAPSLLLKALLPVDSFAAVTQADIDSARSAAPEIDGALAAMTGTDADGTPVAIATIRLRDTGDEGVQDAERRINQLAAGAEGPLRVSSVSPVVVEDEYRKATEEGMGPADRTGAAADRGADPGLPAHALGSAAHAVGCSSP